MVGLDLRVHTNTLAGYCITTLGGGDSTDQISQANLRKLKFTNTLYLLLLSLA
jgi:hypothetical protein